MGIGRSRVGIIMSAGCAENSQRTSHCATIGRLAPAGPSEIVEGDRGPLRSAVMKARSSLCSCNMSCFRSFRSGSISRPDAFDRLIASNERRHGKKLHDAVMQVARERQPERASAPSSAALSNACL